MGVEDVEVEDVGGTVVEISCLTSSSTLDGV